MEGGGHVMGDSSKVNGAGFLPRSVQFIKSRAVPVYGYNPLRWLLRRPKFYRVEHTFITMRRP